MAWRPTEYLIEGVLDNRNSGKVTGWMKFVGMDEKVVFDLEGNFHRDIRGAKVRLRGDGESADAAQAAKYMEGFSTLQKGKVGDMTAGLAPVDYVEYGYYAELNVMLSNWVFDDRRGSLHDLTQHNLQRHQPC